jgi:hypothetical protein
MKEKLRRAIEKYLDPDSKQAKSGLKGAITKIVNAIPVSDTGLIREVLQEFSDLPNWLRLRFEKGSLYEENGCVFGWYSDSQLQAKPLPVELNSFSYHDETTDKLRIVKYILVIGAREGFYPAVPMPIENTFGGDLPKDVYINIPIDDTLNFLEMWKHGWASPCPIQWSRGKRQIRNDSEGWISQDGYTVDRSIIAHGFWVAWKWWPGCQLWYLNKRPELFEESEWWGPPRPDCAKPELGSMVLGVQNREFWERNKFYMED